MAHSLYDVLLVSPRADRELIAVVYRHLAKRYHPDKDASPQAAARMAELNDAYAVLSDPVRRAQYDRRSLGDAAEGPDVLRGDGRPTRSGGANTATSDGRPFGEAGAPPSNPPPEGKPLMFGRYRGWTLNQVERYDHDYVEWLSRTTMGRNYKLELDRILRRIP